MTSRAVVRDSGIGGSFSAAMVPLATSLGGIGRWATLGGLVAYFIATLTDGGNFQLSADLNLLKAVLLVALLPAVADAFRPNTIAAAMANGGAILVLGVGVLGVIANTWWGSGGIEALIVLGDVALGVGFMAFLGRAAAERRIATANLEVPMIVVAGIAMVALVALERDSLFERFQIRVTAVWFVVIAVIAASLLTRSRPGLIAGGAAATVWAIVRFDDDAFRIWFRSYGNERYVGIVALLGLGALAGFQLMQLGPVAPSAGRAAPTPGSSPPIGDGPLSGPAPAGGPPDDYASFGARLGAILIDGFIMSIPWFVLYAMAIAAADSGSAAVSGFAFLACMVGYVILLVAYCRRAARTGQTWGQSAVGIYMVGERSGRPINAGAVFGRVLARMISALPCYLGFFWMLWDPRRQTWHDKMAGSVIVRSMMPTGGDDLRPGSSTFQSGVAPPQPGGSPPQSGVAPPQPGGSTLQSGVAPPQPGGSPPQPGVAPPPPGVAPPQPQPETPPFEPTPARNVARGPVAPPLPPQRAQVSTPVSPLVSPDDLGIDRTVHRGHPPERAVLSVSDGRRVELDGLLLVGRDPSPRPDDPLTELLSLDGDLLVSKTHLAVGVDGQRVWVQDRNSTNGVTLERGDSLQAIVPGAHVELQPGDRIHLGDHWLELSSPE